MRWICRLQNHKGVEEGGGGGGISKVESVLLLHSRNTVDVERFP